MSPPLLLGLWVQRNMTTCRFAARLMKEKKLALVEGGLDQAPRDVERLNATLEQAGARGMACMIFYPELQREEQLVDVLQQLCCSHRWRGKVPTDTFGDKLAIRVDWLTAEDKWSNCLGTAPLLTMPVPRRSPYAALILWPGPAKNSNRSRVGITDIPTPYPDTAQHEEMLAATEADVRQVFGGDTKLWRNITFCIDNRHQGAVEAALKGG